MIDKWVLDASVLIQADHRFSADRIVNEEKTLHGPNNTASPKRYARLFAG